MTRRDKDVSPGWVDALTGWRRALKAAGRSPGTIATRTDHIARASRALGGSPWTTTAAELVDWVGGQDWARDTRRSVYASLRGFWAWGIEVGLVDASPAARLPTVQPTPPAPRPAPEPVIRAGLTGADDRLRIILRLAAEAGLRRAEIAQVHQRDLVEDLAGWSLVVHGKGGKDRLVPLSDSLALAVRGRFLASPWLLPGDDNGHLSARYVGVLAARALPGEWTLHTLRHRFATAAYAGERDLLAVQQLLGHTSVATTQRYVRPPDDALRRAAAYAVSA